ncbi:Osmotin, thaumatin-like protein [Lentinus brumalis]|uniref:Osmotin, thaumatin-like protein n=1 Tax=Lentinus brumalis TaxID=2498619 RepID=A0A371DIJ1_9APHY|nr:Osmotin, thaumatin-like protein [Polyporus brumalis]
MTLMTGRSGVGLSSLLLLAYTPEGVQGRTFTVVNACPFTIWPAMYTDLAAGTAVPDFPTGWEAPPWTSVTIAVPDNWKAGRIWGRRDCDFTITTGPTCLDGWCIGGLLCDPTTGTGVPPATVAEWTLQGDGNRDFYDVSLVDGYNLPMAITNTANCPVADCAVDLGPNCPAPIQGPFDSTGYPVGCKSACFANLDGNPNNSPNCCSGSFGTAAACPPSGVQYYDYFKGNCPNAYAYAFDESSGSALWTCDSGLNADYTLTFCPPGQPAANAASASNSSGSAVTSAPAGVSPAAGGSLSSTSAIGDVVPTSPTKSAPASASGSTGGATGTSNGDVPRQRGSAWWIGAVVAAAAMWL